MMAVQFGVAQVRKRKAKAKAKAHPLLKKAKSGLQSEMEDGRRKMGELEDRQAPGLAWVSETLIPVR